MPWVACWFSGRRRAATRWFASHRGKHCSAHLPFLAAPKWSCPLYSSKWSSKMEPSMAYWCDGTGLGERVALLLLCPGAAHWLGPQLFTFMAWFSLLTGCHLSCTCSQALLHFASRPLQIPFTLNGQSLVTPSFHSGSEHFVSLASHLPSKGMV